MKKVIITGGAGFIGSELVRYLVAEELADVVNLDALTYAGNLYSLEEVESSPLYHFERANICDAEAVARVFERWQPDGIIHLAAESHVDRSISGPSEFINTNVLGTSVLLEEARRYLGGNPDKASNFRFHHVSTDEVYGDLDGTDLLFTEETPYSPSSPYSASKAGSDHLVRAWIRTFGLNAVITNCSNNYGPYQFPEKLIPVIIQNALSGKPIPVYGKGDQIRDWLYVGDHARAIWKVFTESETGETYNIGGHNEKQNIEVVTSICALLDELVPNGHEGISNYADLITYVTDRPGHDRRYAIDATKIKQDLGWLPEETFETGLRKTVMWYLESQSWCDRILSGEYRNKTS